MSITLKTAVAIIEKATAKAEEINVPVYIAVVDQGGNLVAQHRMDSAILVSETISRNKAYTALATRMGTDTLGTFAQPGQPLYGIESTQGGRIVIFGGGFPLISEGKVVGAIGVSGGSVDEDMAVATAGRNYFQ